MLISYGSSSRLPRRGGFMVSTRSGYLVPDFSIYVVGCLLDKLEESYVVLTIFVKLM